LAALHWTVAQEQCEADGGTDCTNPNHPTKRRCRGTDLNGNRFSAVANFLSQCQINQNPDNLYGVIGFSSFFVPPRNLLNRECSDSMVSKSNAINEINGLRDLQTAEVLATTPRGAESYFYPFKQRETSYRQAFACLEDKLLNNVRATDNNREIKVLFITDGKPSDLTGSSVTPNSEYLSQLQSLQSFLQNQAIPNVPFKMIFQPIYYGFGSSPGDPAEDIAEKNEAVSRLNEMAASVNIDPPAPISTVVLDPTQTSFSSQLSQSLCQSPPETRDLPFVPYQELQTFNLTGLQSGTNLVTDSDMDGIPDDQEIGAAKTTARSNRIQDLLCTRFSSQCTRFLATNPVCDENSKVGFGFSACDKLFIDQRILDTATNTNVKEFTGIDYDRDNIPDYIELIKGQNMFSASDVDFNDGDGASAHEEIVRGTDPRSFTSEADAQKYSIEISYSDQTSTCNGQTGFSIFMGRAPLVENILPTTSNILQPTTDKNTYVTFYWARPFGIDARIRVFARMMEIDRNQNLIPGALIDVGEILP
jgi:hypothetical protein